ncbi:MAG: biopolymer transporter ExbD [Phycisphaerales bacterium]|nr:biopolymer transporter ExbD [Planctomycetota bacterium]
MNFRAPKERGITAIPRLSLVAFIDIVLFLLLYLMLAGSLAPSESRLSTGLEQPASASASVPELPPIMLRVARPDGALRFSIGQRAFESEKALLETLSQSPRGAGVIVSAGDGAVVGDVAAALQAAKDAGFVQVSYAANR